MTRRAVVSAPAKVNLGLRVVGQRSDGLHELDSVFLPLDLADTVEIEVRDEPGVGLEVEGREVLLPPGGSNLAVRAAEAFLAAAHPAAAPHMAWGAASGVALRLTKRIPVAAGLGGGSSDAGAVLRGLRGLLPGAVAPDRLAALALALGADVPFFLDPRPARVRGVGERIEPLVDAPRLVLLLANPGVALSTAEVFRAYDALTPALPALPAPPALTPLEAEPKLGAPNDLMPAAVRLCPPIGRLLRTLREVGAEPVGMTGSGPTVFGVFENESRAGEALEAAGFVQAGSGRAGRAIWAQVVATVESPQEPG